jgi:hypothetical protein
MGLDRIRVAQDMGKRRAVLSTVMNFRIPYNVGEFLD